MDVRSRSKNTGISDKGEITKRQIERKGWEQSIGV